MSAIPASYLDLEKARKQEDIVRLTAEQVIKDFASFGIVIHFSGDPGNAYNELFIQLSSQLQSLLDKSYSRLKAILYQIDVKESNLNKALPDGKEYHEYLAVCILDREFEKVLTRIYFRENSGKPGESLNPGR
jgi:hypothetical protein